MQAVWSGVGSDVADLIVAQELLLRSYNHLAIVGRSEGGVTVLGLDKGGEFSFLWALQFGLWMVKSTAHWLEQFHNLRCIRA